MRLSQLSYSMIKIKLQLLIRQLRKLLAEMSIDKLLHMPLVIPRNFLTFDALVEQVTEELSHKPEASPHEVTIFLEQL